MIPPPLHLLLHHLMCPGGGGGDFIKMDLNNRYVTIKHQINGVPKESDFEMKTVGLVLSVEAGSNQVLLKNIYVSIDPGQINRMKENSSSQNQNASNYALGLSPGQVINAYGVGIVIESANPGFEKDDLVLGFIGWEEYSLVHGGDIVRKLDTTDREFPLSNYLGILGLSGLTAYVGLFNVCKPQKGERVFVSAASGAIGNVVGQFAKLFGCYVVGCAGTKQKVHLLTEKLGFDAAFNYKEEPDLKAALKRFFPDGIDVYFDNVGGEMLEAATDNMNLFGRVAVCGVISEYTDAKKQTGPDMTNVVYKRITIQGFFALDYIHDQFTYYISTASDHLRNGKLYALEDIAHGVESIPSAFVGLFRGDNIGKKMVQLANA